MFGSHLTGWKTNDNVYSTAKSLSGPWSEWKTFAEPGSNTYDSQTNFVLQLANTTIYMGNRWDSDNLMRSSYVWLPLDIVGDTVTMRDRRNWLLNNRGYWAEGRPGSTYEAESATLLGKAEVIKCAECSSGKAVGHIDGTGSGVVFSSVSSSANMHGTVLFHHRNEDTFQKFGTLHVNGGPFQQIAFLPSGNGTTGASISAVHITLKKGYNEIELRGVDKKGPVIDKLEVLYP